MTASSAPPQETRQKGGLRCVLVVTVITIAVIAASRGIFKLTQEDRPDGAIDANGVIDPRGDVSRDGSPGEGGVGEIDIVEANVAWDGSSIVFRVRVASTLSTTSKERPVSFRWNLFEEGQETWFLLARLENKAVASLVSPQTSYGASTNDNTLPGEVTVTDDRVLVRISASQVPKFPSTFDWALQASHFGDPKEPSSPTATDRAPDSGLGHL